jgi:hypothetical protein
MQKNSELWNNLATLSKYHMQLTKVVLLPGIVTKESLSAEYSCAPAK